MTRHATVSQQFGFFDARPKHRLFLGLWLDPDASATASDLAGRLRQDGIIRGKPVDADRLHVTLFHLGDFADQIPPSLIPDTQAAAASLSFTPFDVSFDQILGTSKHVLLRPSQDLSALRDFWDKLHVALAKAGVRPNKPVFAPHVTLSYDPGEIIEQPVEPIGWQVRGFHLVESLLGQHRHIRRGSWPI